MNHEEHNSLRSDVLPAEASHSGGGRKLAFGAIASGAVNLIKVGLQLLLLPIMARLLGPEEFGIYALVLPTISFVTLLADGGLGATLAREPESSSLVWSSAFCFLRGLHWRLGPVSSERCWDIWSGNRASLP
jgi:ethanolamine transporter EutH